ncbi:hypothetical protein [Microbacterium hibisci]|uniref:hypothetical protein n=1 Tax=Microbacterium hibisci TaxID=2036000 RepID=UPI001944F558|nr:hypothetical protein [Microbacterium hibisci]
MSATSNATGRTGTAGRVRVLLALDGPVAATMLTVFQYFVVSISFIGCLVPVVAFTALVGWQPTHLALWLGVLSLLPLVPAGYALLRSSRRLLADRADAQGGRLYWRSFVVGCRTLWWAAAGASAVALLLAYDLALFGDSDAMLLFVAAGAAVAVMLLIAVCVVAAAGVAAGVARRPIETLSVAARAVARRPHIGLAWLLIIALGLIGAGLPIIGSAFALFLPALLGAAIHICNDALCLPLTDETRRTP